MKQTIVIESLGGRAEIGFAVSHSWVGETRRSDVSLDITVRGAWSPAAAFVLSGAIEAAARYAREEQGRT